VEVGGELAGDVESFGAPEFRAVGDVEDEALKKFGKVGLSDSSFG